MLEWLLSKYKKRTDLSDWSNKEWIEKLRNPPDDKALEELKNTIRRGLKKTLGKYEKNNLDQVVDDYTDQSINKILSQLEAFKGNSRFVTWAMKIAVRESFYLIRTGQSNSESNGEIKEKKAGKKRITDSSDSAEDNKAVEMIKQKVMSIMQEELDDKERAVLNTILAENMSITVASEKLNVERQELFLRVHDIRKKIKNGMQDRGIDADNALASFVK